MNIVILLCAGRGEKLLLEQEKCFVEINHLSLYEYSLNTFYNHKDIDKIILVCSLNSLSCVNIDKYKDKVEVIVGGNTRQDSVFHALDYLKENHIASMNDNILIHDGARPLVDNKIINDCLSSLKTHDFNITCLLNSDTTFLINSQQKVEQLLNRNNIVFEQTPTAVKFDIIYQLHLKAKKDQLFDIHDDASLALKYHKDVFIVKGNLKNFKITYKEDLNLLKFYLAQIDK